MSKQTFLCAICTKREVTEGYICAHCYEQWQSEIEREPIPEWLIEAQRIEQQRRKSERTAQRHEDDPTPEELSSRMGNTNLGASIDMQAFIENIVGAFGIELTPGQRIHFMEKMEEFWHPVQAMSKRRIITDRECKALLADTIVEYSLSYSSLKPQWTPEKSKLDIYRAMGASAGIVDTLNWRRFAKARNRALERLRKFQNGAYK